MPSKSTALFNCPGTPEVGQVAPEHIPSLVFEEESTNVVAPAFSFSRHKEIKPG